MKLALKCFIFISLLSLLQGCFNELNKQTGGTLIGGVTGALLGSRFGKNNGNILSTGFGAVAGALIGGQIGKTMDDSDRKLLEISSQQALEYNPIGKVVEWRNPDNNHCGYVTPIKTFINNSGEHCREYSQIIIIDGEKEKAYGTACRKPDGSWQMR